MFLALIVVCTALRLSLAVAVTRYVNNLLGRHEDYRGEMAGVEINLWRGAYRIHDLKLFKRSGEEVLEPFLQVRTIDLSVQWSGLIHGMLVGEVTFVEPDVNFVLAPSPAHSQTHMDKAWQQTLLDLFPFRIDTVQVARGKLRYRDLRKQPVVDVDLTDLQGVARNLTNVRKPTAEDDAQDKLPASVDAVARPLGQGQFWLKAHLDPFAAQPTFDLDLSLAGLDLVRLNDFLRAYASLDVESGQFHMFAELASAQGRFTGYVKPFLEDVQVFSFREIQSPADALQALWEAIAGEAAKLLENRQRGHLAARVPFEGRIENPEAGVVAAIGTVLTNAFLRALVPAVEGTVELEDAEQQQTGTEKKERDEDAQRRARESGKTGANAPQHAGTK